MRVIWSAVAAAMITGLVYAAVHPDPVLARLGTLPLMAVLWAVFAAGVWLVRKIQLKWAVALILLGGIAVQVAALSAPPRTSDDLYRYIWDGRVQAAGFDPYHYAPAAPELVPVRDPFLWNGRAPHCVSAGETGTANAGEALTAGCTMINRPVVPTIYPPVAEAYFLVVRYLSPPGAGSTPIQAGAALCAIAVTIALLAGLKSMGRDPRLAVLWAWCPEVALEAGNNAHVDMLATAIAAGALLVLAKAGTWRRSLAGGALIGLAIAAKFTPVLMLPSVLRRRRWAVVLPAVAAAAALVYLPHVLRVRGGVLGFLPIYLKQEGYGSGSRFVLLDLLVPDHWATLAAFAVLAVTAFAVIRRGDPGRPWHGAVVMAGVALAVATPPYSWYATLLVMLVAFDGRAEWLAFAAMQYLAAMHPLPSVALSSTTAERIRYGTAVVIVVAVSAARWARARRTPAVPAPPGAAQAGATQAVPATAGAGR
jgi:Glycosyltransferase family 87